MTARGLLLLLLLTTACRAAPPPAPVTPPPAAATTPPDLVTALATIHDSFELNRDHPPGCGSHFASPHRCGGAKRP